MSSFSNSQVLFWSLHVTRVCSSGGSDGVSGGDRVACGDGVGGGIGVGGADGVGGGDWAVVVTRYTWWRRHNRNHQIHKFNRRIDGQILL